MQLFAIPDLITICFMIINLGKRTATQVGLSRDNNVTYDVTYSSPAKLQRTEGPQKVSIMFSVNENMFS